MIARKSALIVAVSLINGILGYIGLFFVARYMQSWEYGIVSFAFGFVAIFAIFSQLGFDQAHVKRVSEGQDFGVCIGTFMFTKTLLAGLMSCLVIGSVAVWYGLGRGFETALHEKAIYIMLSYFVLATLTQSIISTFNAKKQIAKSQFPLFLYTLVRVGATIFVAYNGLGVLALAYTYLFGEIFYFIFALLLFKNYPVSRPSVSCFRNYYSFAMPMAVASASYIIMTNIDKVFIQLFWTAKQVGEYAAVFNLSRFIVLFSSAVGTLLLPTISAYHVKNDINKIIKLTIKAERYLSMISIPLVVLLIVLANPVIYILLSDRYLPALTVLQILPLFVLFEVLAGPYCHQLSGMNMPKITRNRVLIMMIVNVTLNLILIPADIQPVGLKLAGLGATGAAIATVVSYATGLVYARVMVWKITKNKGNQKIYLHFLAGSIMAAVLYITLRSLNMAEIFVRWYHLLGLSLLGLGIYIGILYIFKEFTKKDFYFFFDTLNIKKIWRYAVEEIKRKH
jgi:O-antigen/teichoic acid export membrane protein